MMRAGLALGALGLVLLAARRAAGASTPSTRPPPPSPIPPPPAGYRYARSVGPAVTARARAMLGAPLGTVEAVEDGGRTYVLRMEWHFDDHAGGGLRWHPGVSAFEPVAG